MRPVLSDDFIQASLGSTSPCFTRANKLSFIVTIPCFFEVCMIEGIWNELTRAIERLRHGLGTLVSLGDVRQVERHLFTATAFDLDLRLDSAGRHSIDRRGVHWLLGEVERVVGKGR